MLHQLSDDSLTSPQLQHGLDMLLHLETQWPQGIVSGQEAVRHNLQCFLQAKVSCIIFYKALRLIP